MYIRNMYLVFVFIMSVASISILRLNLKRQKVTANVRFKKNLLSTFKKSSRSKKSSHEIDNQFSRSGIKLSSFTYKLARYVFFGIWVIILIASILMYHYINKLQLISCIAGYFLTTPKMTIFGYKTPFNYAINALTFEYRNRKNREIHRAVSQLKNLSIATINTSIGSDYILQELMKFTKITNHIFATTLKYWYENDRKVACDYFANTVDTREGQELASVFYKLDNLSPHDLKEQLELCQTIFKEEKRTTKERRNEYKGYFLYSTVVISILIILLNFVTMILYLNTLDTFKSIVNFNQ